MNQNMPQQKFCNKCYTPLAPGARFCPECGTPAPQQVVGICPNCGQPVMEGQTACYSCGALVSGATVAPVKEMPQKKPANKTGLWVGIMAGLLVAIIAVAVVLLFQPREAESVAFAKSRVSLLPGDRVQLRYEVLPENTPDKSVTWESSDSTVVTVKNGEVVALEPGTCTVTVTTANGKKDTCKITVSEFALEELILSEQTLTLYVGESHTLTCDTVPLDAPATLTWSCDRPEVLSVREGELTALALGTCTLTVTADNGVSAQCAVTVEARQEEQLPVGDWNITMVENRFDETVTSGWGVQLQLSGDLSGQLTQNNEAEALTWAFSEIDSDGDYWYDVQLGEESLQILYNKEADRLSLYLADENWVFTRVK